MINNLNAAKRTRDHKSVHCQHCHKPFLTLKDTQKFCSSRCRSAAHNQMRKTAYQGQAAHVGKVLRQYMEADDLILPDSFLGKYLYCPQCGKEFRCNDKRKKFCSTACKTRYFFGASSE